MRVGFSDPVGPRRWRVLPYALPLLLYGLAIALSSLAIARSVSTTAAVLTAVAATAIFHVLGLLPTRGARRSAELTCGAGQVTIAGAGTRSQVISAKDIAGATTARTRTGILLALAHRERAQPITIEVANDAEAERIRHALGIGHGGFGTIAWRTQPGLLPQAAIVGRGVVLACLALFVAMFFAGGLDAATEAIASVAQFAFVGGLFGIIGLLAKPGEPTVMMAPDGLRLRTQRGWFALPYGAVASIQEQARALFFSVPAPFNSVTVNVNHVLFGGISPAEQEMLLAQVRAATQRARGLGPRKEDVTGRMEVLRRHGESPRDWLARLDLAGQTLRAGTGYRGQSFDVEDLWALLEDPDADAELRAAAARVLKHGEGTRIRIDAAVAAVRDETTNRRLRIAVDDDLDAATRELAFLDATEPTPLQQMRR